MGRKVLGANVLRASAAVALMAAGAACTPVREFHGFVAEDADATSSVQVGVDTKTTVQQRLGSPSTTAVLDQTAWYYVSATQERFAFYHPRTSDRSVMVVRFDANDTVTEVDHFGIERGRVISYNTSETPTRGRELGIVEQIFGNIGRSSPLPRSDEEDRTRPGRR